MRLQRLIEALGEKIVFSPRDNFPVRGISCDSRKVAPGHVFVALKGSCQDGNVFIQEAFSRGAGIVLAEKPSRRGTGPQIKISDGRKALSLLSRAFYGNAGAKIKIAGITGTNGKTTVTYLIEAILERGGWRPAVIGTVNYRFAGKVFPSGNTTPGPLELEGLFARMLKSRVGYVLMEVSSHALEQSRTEGIDFHSAVFTNLTQDHLDYHGTLEKYFQAKCRLFRGLKSRAYAVLNNDDPYSRRLKRMTAAKVITYGIDNHSDVMARDLSFSVKGTNFILKARGRDYPLSVKLIGRHNLYNILAAAAWAQGAGLPMKKIIAALEDFSFVPGRLERIDAPGGFSVFVDYAHTDDALKNVITALRAVSGGRIITVFGCGGERDKSKRPKMGRVVCRLSDYAVVTNDNPRSEPPLKIIADIRRGLRGKNFCVIPDRHAAIKKALSMAAPGDIVLVAGKGHEDYQIIRGKKTHFDDREAVRECLA